MNAGEHVHSCQKQRKMNKECKRKNDGAALVSELKVRGRQLIILLIYLNTQVHTHTDA